MQRRRFKNTLTFPDRQRKLNDSDGKLRPNLRVRNETSF